MDSKWVCTDDECYQWRLALGNRRYYFCEVIWLEGDTGDDVDDSYLAVGTVVDVGEMTWREMILAINGYYDSIESMLKSYGMDINDPDVDEFVDSMVAECAFENIYSDNDYYDYAQEFTSRTAAEKAVDDMKKYMEERI